jgi:hypothetical protein
MRKNAKGNESSVQCPAERPWSHSEQEESDGDGYTIDHIVRSANLVPGNEHREAQGEGNLNTENHGTAHVRVVRIELCRRMQLCLSPGLCRYISSPGNGSGGNLM